MQVPGARLNYTWFTRGLHQRLLKVLDDGVQASGDHYAREQSVVRRITDPELPHDLTLLIGLRALVGLEIKEQFGAAPTKIRVGIFQDATLSL